MGYEGEGALLRDQVAVARDAGCEGAVLLAYDPARRDLLDAFAGASRAIIAVAKPMPWR